MTEQDSGITGSSPESSKVTMHEPREAAHKDATLPQEDKSKLEKKKKKKKGKRKIPGTLGTSRGVETLFRTSYQVNMNLSSLADAKSNIMISINGIIISIIIGAISSKIDTNPWLVVPTVILLIGCLGSMVYAVLAARPRVSSKFITLDEVRKSKANILFFGNFGRMDEEDFVKGMTDLIQNTDLVYLNMIRDTYGLGLVLLKKYHLLRISYSVFMVSLVSGVAVFVVILILVANGTISTTLVP